MSDYIKTLEYYFEDGSHIVFEKYTINALDGIIKNKKSGKTPSYGKGRYNVCGVVDDEGKLRTIRIARAVASTFIGKPATFEHTADHIESKQKKNDALMNIRWNCKKGQSSNRIMPKTNKTAFVVVKNGVEKTVKEWVAHMNANRTLEEREFTKGDISYYAQRKTRGFAYKEYPLLEGEKWEPIKGSKNKRGDYWEISNMNRVKWNTKYAENVLSGKRLGCSNGYPIVGINGKNLYCHILAFKTFYPELWATKEPEEMVLHEDDDKKDFRPHKLRLGTASNNAKDSHTNGKRDGTKSARIKCASYVNGVLEKDDYTSIIDAAEYLKSKESFEISIKNIAGNIGKALSDKYEWNIAYGRTWQKIV